MKELIFNIKDIFDNNSQSGCLYQYESNFYHIPAYQRGYKWASTENGAVTILLNDLWKAFESYQNQERTEYYLQYITVKKIILNNTTCLEVIDGQQRLTTLSVMLSVLALQLQKDNIADTKLDYAIRDNFFNNEIYPLEKLKQNLVFSWEQLIENPDFNKQDIYYIFSGAKKCDSFFSNKKQLLLDFYNFLLHKVKLIVNSVESHIESETVFKNLNSNKVPLTEAELIKGLLITKVGRASANNSYKSFQEISEIRMNIGRQWDEITLWVNKPEIKSFYFNNKTDAMHEFLTLVAIILEEGKKKSLSFKSNDKDFPLFNFYLDYNNFQTVFATILKVKNTLLDWYESTKIYNLIGYCRFVKNGGKNNLDFIQDIFSSNSRSELTDKLIRTKSNLLSNIDFDTLSYDETAEKIHHILLAINVFIEGQDKIRFNFYEYEKEKWTLEHIFPQTPEGKNKELKPEGKEAIIDILGKDISEEVIKVLSLETRSEVEKEIYYKALKAHPALNSIANMCLLTGGDNASNGNKFFDEKRDNILKLIRNGSFVPKHTFDVFSKMFTDANTEKMKVWSNDDLQAHLVHIKNQLV